MYDDFFFFGYGVVFWLLRRLASSLKHFLYPGDEASETQTVLDNPSDILDISTSTVVPPRETGNVEEVFFFAARLPCCINPNLLCHLSRSLPYIRVNTTTFLRRCLELREFTAAFLGVRAPASPGTT